MASIAFKSPPSDRWRATPLTTTFPPTTTGAGGRRDVVRAMTGRALTTGGALAIEPTAQSLARLERWPLQSSRNSLDRSQSCKCRGDKAIGWGTCGIVELWPTAPVALGRSGLMAVDLVVTDGCCCAFVGVSSVSRKQLSSSLNRRSGRLSRRLFFCYRSNCCRISRFSPAP